jgi:type III pantothenate kinase
LQPFLKLLLKKLIIDYGNTLQKLAIFDGRELLEKQTYQGINAQQLQDFLSENEPFHAIILSSVANHSPDIEEALRAAAPLLVLGHTTPLPIRNFYLTPETLGNDRLAAAVGAHALYPGRNALSIDAGTCITYDFLTENAEYLGGAISPGIRMRFRAMNAFTGRLPLIENTGFQGLTGRNTEESMISGVINGVCEEIKGSIGLYAKQYGDITAVITGGDHELLHTKLKINIFAVPDLVLLGLNEILDYNDVER